MRQLESVRELLPANLAALSGFDAALQSLVSPQGGLELVALAASGALVHQRPSLAPQDRSRCSSPSAWALEDTEKKRTGVSKREKWHRGA